MLTIWEIGSISPVDLNWDDVNNRELRNHMHFEYKHLLFLFYLIFSNSSFSMNMSGSAELWTGLIFQPRACLQWVSPLKKTWILHVCHGGICSELLQRNSSTCLLLTILLFSSDIDQQLLWLVVIHDVQNFTMFWNSWLLLLDMFSFLIFELLSTGSFWCEYWWSGA